MANDPMTTDFCLDATVLIVDDNANNLEVIENGLKGHGLRILVAGNGELALKRIHYVHPDLILLDVMMPGINGFEVCLRLKSSEETKNIPVIFMTALTDSEHKIEGFQAGAVDYITKPVQKEELLARVITHLKVYKYQENLEKEVQRRTIELEERLRALDHEISVRKQTEDKLLQLRNYLADIINSMPSILIGVDVEGRVTQWNKTAEKTAGVTADEARGKHLLNVFPQMAPEMEKIKASIETRETKQELKRPRSSEAGTHYENVTVYPLVNNDVVEGAVIRIEDVTETVRLEEMVVQSEKMLSIGGLAAGMAHEINNPLAGMIQTSDVMKNRMTNLDMSANKRAAEKIGININDIKAYLDEREILRMIDAVIESGRRIAEIVSNMLNFARKSENQNEVSSHALDKLLDKTLVLAATDYDLKKNYDFKSIEIKKEFENNLPLVPCEEAKIQQVLLNILSNGALAMQEARTRKPRFILRTRFEESQKTVCLEIEDNGPGMNEATRKRVFDPFFTTKPPGVGTGLGLSVSYFIITVNHRGEISVESQPGSGAKFIIRLPLERASLN